MLLVAVETDPGTAPHSESQHCKVHLIGLSLSVAINSNILNDFSSHIRTESAQKLTKPILAYVTKTFRYDGIYQSYDWYQVEIKTYIITHNSSVSSSSDIKTSLHPRITLDSIPFIKSKTKTAKSR